MKFHELLQRMRDQHDKLDDQYGEILDEDATEIDELEGDVTWWLDHLAGKYVESQGHLARTQEMVEKYQTRLKRFERRMEYYKAGLGVLLDISGKSHTSPVASVFKKSSPDSVEIVDESLIPIQFLSTVENTKIDKTAINKYIKANGDTPYAKMVPGKVSVVVKV